MILTDKAKEHFNKWNKDNDYLLGEYIIKSGLIYEPLIHALIIEWFDSVGIYINVGGVIMDNVSCFCYDIQQNNTLNGLDKQDIDNRQEATKQAIIKANEIYNNQN